MPAQAKNEKKDGRLRDFFKGSQRARGGRREGRRSHPHTHAHTHPFPGNHASKRGAHAIGQGNEAALDLLFRQMDRDGDGAVDFDEFQTVMADAPHNTAGFEGLPAAMAECHLPTEAVKALFIQQVTTRCTRKNTDAAVVNPNLVMRLFKDGQRQVRTQQIAR